MTATDTIRAMLDERGVEWRGGLPTETMVEADGLDLLYVALQDGRVRAFIRNHLTPEQAIEATLGRGECKLTHTRDKPRSKAPTLTCSECGWWTDRINDEWRYCPSCGKRVKA